MDILGGILMLMGVLLSFIYGVILIIKAFQASILWGLGYIFVPFVGLIFVITNWDEAGKPFLLSLLAIPFYLVGTIMMR